ncbi:DNA translocase FtsK [Neptunicoccus sediminis]|uniref:DNA translocase FtsK n=1 Tax=Neptunicoccus sediminis TaxID=1892596 RepID=UPI000845EFFF|nr:DNA translocase FtsK [Neptunicoccus sediminis]
MAYQARTRDPLLETHMQEAIRKRGTELIGLAMVGFAILMGAMLWTYSPKDPSWLSATSAPAQNILGTFGASISSRLMLTIGWASWCLPVLFFVWGSRFVLHIGDNRLLSRAVSIPVFVAFTAVFLATHVPLESWQHGFGLGGLSGDAAVGILMDLVPLQLTLRLIVITLALAFLFVVTSLFALGFSKQELSYISQYALVAVILTYASIVSFLNLVVQGGAKGAVAARTGLEARRATRKETAAQKAPLVAKEEAKAEPDAIEKIKPLRGITLPKLKLPTLRKAQTEQEAEDDEALIEPLPPEVQEEHVHDEDRVRNRINDAIKTKVLRARTLRVQNTPPEPVVTENIFRDSADDGYAVMPALGGASRGYGDDVAEPPVSFQSVRARAEVAAPAAPAPTQAAEPVAPARPRPPQPEAKQVVQPRAPRTAVKQSKRAQEEAQPSLFKGAEEEYETPPLDLLAHPSSIVRHHLSDEALEENARMLENVLDDYGVKGEIVSVRPGPVVTMYELEPAPGLKASRVIGLADDIARSMSALSARVSTVPGKSVIGIELPNEKRETVLLRELLASQDYGDGEQNLPLALGKDIGGKSMIANLAKMPHLLIAGTTGSGKSVAINTMILSLLYKLSPDECRMIMIDPKMLELSVYDGIPHLLSPVVTDPKKAVVALKWVVGEMEERYRKMSKMGVRNIGGYNARVEAALKKGEDFTRTVQTGFDDDTGEPVFETETFTPEKMPYIVVIVDEMADLMMVAGKEIEACIQRLAQMARASGIHLIMATQRPSVDVITGTIKANFPTRISFQVTSKIDSRTILGEMGAEQLLGMGDMLYMAGGGKVTRVHAPFASDEEVEEVVNHLKALGAPEYVSGVVEGPADDKESDIDAVLGLGSNTNGEDALYDQAVAIVIKDRKCSTSYIQRKLSIGYNKAAKLVEQMEEQGVVSQANHVGKREILVPEQH